MDNDRVLGSDDCQRRRLAELLAVVAVHDGAHPTAIEGVELLRWSRHAPRAPVIYQPKIVIVGQGSKRGYLGDQVYRYDPDHYLVLSVPLPFECETHGSPEKPLLGVGVTLDPTRLREMVLELDEMAVEAEAVPRGIYSTELTTELRGSVIRLLECLCSPRDSRMLGPQLAREVIYRVLCGEQGGALRALASRNENFTRIARVLRWIHTEYGQPLTTEGLAQRAGMSVSVFHDAFKRVTTTSPLQYVKQIKLHHARTLMAHDGLSAGVAASKVGYESASQFSREFKRLFGVPPIQDALNLRKRPVAMATA